MRIYNKDKEFDEYGKSNYINNVKMVLITLVVIGHMLTSVRTGDVIARTIYNSIYLFHMPAFILLTGYLSKGAVKNRCKMKMSVINYAVIYLYAQVVYDVIQRLALPAGETFRFTILTPRYALWYMFLLIAWLPCLYVLKSYPRILIFSISIFTSLIVGIFTNIGTNYSLSRAIVFFPFFLLGYYIDLQKIKTYRATYLKVLAISILVMNVIIHYVNRSEIFATWYTGSVSYSSMNQGNLEGMYVRMIYLLMATVVTFSLLLVIPRGEFIFTYVGGRTLQIYLIHAIICRVFYIRGTLIPIKEVTNVWFIILLALIMTLILSNKKLAILVEWPTKLLYNRK